MTHDEHGITSPGSVTLIRALNVYDDGFHEDGIVHLTNKRAAELKNVAVENDDVLLNIACCPLA